MLIKGLLGRNKTSSGVGKEATIFAHPPNTAKDAKPIERAHARKSAKTGGCLVLINLIKAPGRYQKPIGVCIFGVARERPKISYRQYSVWFTFHYITVFVT